MNRGKYQCSIPQRLEGEAAEKYLGFEDLQPFWLINASKNGGHEDFWFKFFMGEGEETRFGLKKNCRCVTFSGWWQPKYFSFSPRKLGKISNLTSIFFKRAETTNYGFECLS